ncbi:hypothetical protein ACPCSE_29255 [Streptomyces cellulosae]
MQFTYTPEYRTGLTFTWEGGEYIDTSTGAVLNVWNHAQDAPSIERTQEAFEAECDEWIRAQDPADGEIGDEVDDLPLSLLLRADGVTLTSEHISMGFEEPEGWLHDEYRVTIHFDGRTYTQTVKHGYGVGKAPELVETVGMLVRQSMTAYAADDYEDWASDFSSDPEQWMPEQTYADNVQMAKDLISLFGADRFDRYAMADHDD